MIRTTITTTFFLLICIGYSRAYWGLENLGNDIRQRVHQSLAPLQNLGSRINHRVQQDLAPLHDFNFLGNQFPFSQEQSYNYELPSLQNLGAQINQQVQEGLEPVRILQSVLKVKYGEGGTTIATYKPGGKRLIILNSDLFVCDGDVSPVDGSCSTTLKKFKFSKKEDFCYASTKSVINNWYCLGSTGSISTAIINGKIFCDSTDGSPILLLKEADYRRTCEPVAKSVDYKYYTSGKLTHLGNGLTCSGEKPQICTFSETVF